LIYKNLVFKLKVIARNKNQYLGELGDNYHNQSLK